MSTYKPNSSNSTIVQETPTGTVNGSNTVFTVLQTKYVGGSLQVFINGLQQTKTTDYVETTPGSGVFTFTTAPLTGDAVRVSYQFSTGASGNADTIDGIHASTTPTANQLLPLDSNASLASYQQGWVAPTLLNSWVNYAGGFDTAGYMKDSTGHVHLKGLVKLGTIGAVIFTLPIGYRPAALRRWATDSNAAYGSVTVDASGNVVAAGSNAWIFLDPVIFKAEA